ncbi:hypothetical protein [Marisediminicola sp. LYQ85]|uniref:hypothetical protein n=1 Tax=Marisediminicola sp. LYQ85 TaxID=3391062 RepID=UPI003983B899
MSRDFSLTDSLSLADLQVFLGRAGRVDDGSVRLTASGRVLAAYVAVLYPSGLLDESPTVLGLRTFALTEPAEFDAVVPVRGLLDRIVRLQNESVDATAAVRVSVPPEVLTATWAAISAPRGGWSSNGSTSSSALEAAARAGIDEVAAAIPSGTGEQIVQRVRSEVWGRPLPDNERVTTGAAFAAYSLGFLPAVEGHAAGDVAPAAASDVAVFEAGPWTRLSTDRGHVLVKRRTRLGLA